MISNDTRLVGAVLVSSLLLTGCGLTSMPSKMDSTNSKMDATNSKMDKMIEKMEQTNTNTGSMPKKMDQTVAGMTQTNANMQSMIGKMEATNKKMDQLIEKIDRTNANTAAMLGKMTETVDGMAKTNSALGEMLGKMDIANEGVHGQAIVVGLDMMFKAASTRYLTPPLAMIPGGEIVAKYAYPHELMKLTSLMLREIDMVRPDTARQGDAAYMQSLADEKYAKVMAVEIIAAMTSQEKVEQIVHDQIEGGGRYMRTALQFLALRMAFTRDVLLDGDILAEKLETQEQLRTAIERISNLDYIARLPYAKDISVKTRGLLPPYDNLNEIMDPRMVVPYWGRVAGAIDQELDPRRAQVHAALVTQLRSEIAKAQSYWSEQK